jgi:hypothetical protein
MKLSYVATIAVATWSMGALCPVFADDSKSYTEGPVSEVTSIRTKPGMFDAYMKWMDTTGKQLREEEKKAGLIVDYAVYATRPRSPGDPDIYVVITYKNLAAMDGFEDRVEPITKKIWSTRDAANKAAVDRESLREILGSQIIRQLNLK